MRIRIRDLFDPGFGPRIDIPDPQDCQLLSVWRSRAFLNSVAALAFTDCLVNDFFFIVSDE